MTLKSFSFWKEHHWIERIQVFINLP